MSDLVDANVIEAIVGARRREHDHIARAVSGEQTVYILHSEDCLATGDDLRACAFSWALDQGIDLDTWGPWQDQPVLVEVRGARLVPLPLPLTTDVAEVPC